MSLSSLRGHEFFFFTPQLVALVFSKTSVSICQTVRRHITEYITFHGHCHRDSKPRIVLYVSTHPCCWSPQFHSNPHWGNLLWCHNACQLKFSVYPPALLVIWRPDRRAIVYCLLVESGFVGCHFAFPWICDVWKLAFVMWWVLWSVIQENKERIMKTGNCISLSEIGRRMSQCVRRLVV